MSVENVMNTISAQESGAEMSAEGESSAGHMQSNTTSKTVRSIEDLFNATYEGEQEDVGDTSPLEKEEKVIPKEEKKNTAKPKEEEQKEEPSKEEEKIEETSESTDQNFKVKINGIEKEVPLQDLLNSYSGQQEIQRRFTEFDKQKKTWEKETAQDKEFTKYVMTEIDGLKTNFQSVISQYEKTGYVDKNPITFVNQLLDNMGINSNLFERALFEHMLPDYANYFNMSDVEREAFYTKKENEYLRKKEQGFTERDRQLNSQKEQQQKDFELIRSAGLDSVKYEELSKELEGAGIKDLTVDKIVDYAKQKPLLDRIVTVFNEAGLDSVGNDKAKTVYKILTEFPDTTNEEILEYLSPEKSVLKTAQVLSQKGAKTPKSVPQKNEDTELNEMLNWFKR
jgi:hypothetical protein